MLPATATRAGFKYLVFAYAPDGLFAVLLVICGWCGGIKKVDPHFMSWIGGWMKCRGLYEVRGFHLVVAEIRLVCGSCQLGDLDRDESRSVLPLARSQCQGTLVSTHRGLW